MFHSKGRPLLRSSRGGRGQDPSRDFVEAGELDVVLPEDRV